jgi:three-Cys-motif partner protein
MTHVFGGPWTEGKLEVMRRYFAAYAQALKNQRFSKWYIDAFAGAGQRTEARPADVEESQLFGDETSEVDDVKDGSVRIALRIEPPFDQYIFVDRDREHVAALEVLRKDFPTRSIDVRLGDANQVLKELCKSTNWRNTRAAVFIDPYGMQVNWSTLEALAATGAVDIALLFPTGPLNRMLVGDGNVPEEWAKRIDEHLGPCDWRTGLYKVAEQGNLFSQNEPSLRKATTADGLRQFVLERLKSTFPFVAEEQLELKNSRDAVLYHLFIICANPAPTAVRLAKKLASNAIKLPRTRKR